jgi:hypothetical protein
MTHTSIESETSVAGFRITKYDPRLRSEDGVFVGDEWTSISDIGRTYPTGVFTLAEYIEVEEAYVEAVRRFLASAGTHSLRVRGLERLADCDTLPLTMAADTAAHLRSLREGTELSGQELEWAVRLNLREMIWCCLEGERGVYVHFGYDYYMYVGLDFSDFVLPPLPPGMYAEPFETPYRANE